MGKVFKISELIGTDIRSRSNAGIVNAVIDGVNEDISLDFTGVTFMSRSFTDELCNILKDNKNVRVINASDFVSTMLEVVQQSRMHKRVRTEENADIRSFNDMESLSSFLVSI